MVSAKQYLATTGISSIWKLNEDILFLGTWCLAEKRNRQLVEGKSYSLVNSPWKPAERIRDAAEYTQHIYNETLFTLSEELNQLHGVSQPDKYWQILLGPWLLHFIEILYERYSRIKNALELFPDLYTHALPEEMCSLVSYDTYDFLSIKGKVSQDWYNLKLFSLVIYSLCPEKSVTAELGSISQESYYRLPPASFKRRTLRSFKKISDSLSRSRIILSDMYNLSCVQMLELELRLNIRIQDLPRVRTLACDGAEFEDFRQRLKFATSSSDNFIVFLNKTLPGAIPLVFVEHYKNHRERIRVNRSIRIVGSAVGWYFNEEFKFLAAEAALSGAKVVEFQHGGGYGMSLSVPSEFMALEKDTFYTWGWHRCADKKVKSLPSPYLSRLKNSAQVNSEEFLFIGTSTHRYVSMFCNYLFPDDMPKYLFDKKVFFDLLSKVTVGKIVYRPYPDVGWEEIGRIREMLPDLKLFQGGVLVNKMRKVKLVIIDHLSTTFLEALTINVPCILFWDHRVNVLRPEAEPYFDILIKAGILYKTPQEAARKVNEIQEDPLIWWMSERTQEYKNRFCQHFALTSKDWVSAWKDEFGAG